MANKLSIRSYQFVSHTHSHDHHQLVFPLLGFVDIHTGRHQGHASPGQCIIILAGDEHHFAPEKGSYFLVLDLDELPENLSAMETSFVRINQPILAFCYFAQKQLEHCISAELEGDMAEWLIKLLSEQEFLPQLDPRIARVTEYLEQDLSHTPSLAELAEIACLSTSHFKALFKQETGVSSSQLLLNKRMEKAKALLVHTDYPINEIALQLGYNDLSAFSHRFSSHFGFPANKLRG